MISELITWVSISFGLQEKVARIVVISTTVLAILLACVAMKQCYDTRVISNHENEQKIENFEKKIKADEKATRQREIDYQKETKNAEERKSEIAKAADEPLPESSLRLGCQRLREQGYDTSQYAECS